MSRPSLVALLLTMVDSEPDRGWFDQLCAQLDPAWIDAVLHATGMATLRRRRLPAEHVIWLVLGMVSGMCARSRRDMQADVAGSSPAITQSVAWVRHQR